MINIILPCFLGQAREVNWLYRSPRGLLMGDAYTQIAEDESTLFYNPALLGRNEGVKLHLLNFNLGITNALDDIEKFQDFPENDPDLITQRMLGFPLYFGLGAAPGLKMAQFGISLLANARSSIFLSNATHPMLSVNYRYDRGFVAGFAFSHKRGRSRKKSGKDVKGFGTGMKTSVGASVKHITREGLDNTFPLFGTALLNKILAAGDKDFYDIRNSLGFSKGKGWGFDVGLDHVVNLRHTQISAGASILNVGGIRFKEFEGEEVPDANAKVNVGFAWRQDFGFLGYDVTVDLKPLNYDIPLGRKVHIGFRLDLPIIDLFAGIGEGYTALGAELDLWIFKLGGGIYGVELGQDFEELEGKRAIIYFNILDFSFDA